MNLGGIILKAMNKGTHFHLFGLRFTQQRMFTAKATGSGI